MYKDQNSVVMRYEDGSYRAVAWNMSRNRSNQDLNLAVKLPMRSDDCYLIVQTVDEETCNPLKVWHDIGEPANLTADQIILLQQTAHPQIRTASIASKENGFVSFEIPVKENGVIYFEVKPRTIHSDRGYDYNRVMQYLDQ